jgi:AcrR family transcriptional regulator
MNPEVARSRGRPRSPDLPRIRRESIIKAATRHFARFGYPNTDLQQIADELGLGKGTIYRYFASKRELFLATVDLGMRRLTEAVNASGGEVADPLDLIRRAIRAYLKFFERNPELTELLIQERAEFKDRKVPTYFIHRKANIGPWRDLMQRLIDEGRVRRVPVDRIMNVASDMLYGAVFTNYFSGRKRSSARQAEEILDIYFHGILSPDRPGPTRGKRTQKVRNRKGC